MTFTKSSITLAVLGLAIGSQACGGESTDAGGNAGAGAGKSTGAGGGGHGASSGGGNSGNSSNGSSTAGPQFTGHGTGYLPLTPGCGPETANSCTGTCEKQASTDPGAIIRAPATLCFGGEEDPTPEDPLATIEQVLEVINGKRVAHLRITFDPAFVDNTYGANACCGWPAADTTATDPAPAGGMMNPDPMGMMKPPKMPKPGKGGHTFDDLVGSDHVELLLTDGTGNTVMDFKVDYITADSSSSCGYRALGVKGGEGKVVSGDASAVLGAATSIDRNLNGCGYCYTTDSPATDSSYTPNADAPAWDYRVVYEVWIDLDAFGSAGFGQAYITNVHASPSKLENNTVEVIATPCPADWDTPMGGSCPQNYTVYIQSEGKSSCVPIPFSNYPNMAPCPAGYKLDAATEGKYCVPS
jgi:hypothetical protein